MSDQNNQEFIKSSSAFPALGSAAQLDIDLGARSYPIYIGQNLLSQAAQGIAWALKSKRLFVISDDQVSTLYQQKFIAAFAGFEIFWHSVPAGESSKSMPQFERLTTALLAQKIERNDTLIAFGGGVVGDLAGFVAASLLRGVPFIQIPTSLLAQVDSSVGGKTGINAPSGKNLIGAFYQPRLVLIDSDFLDSLPQRELYAGYGEVIKYALINQPQLYDWLLENSEKVLVERDKQALHYILMASCRAKAQIVAADEREAGQRALLNLGHTFAHALEAHAGYDGTLLHGEAVMMGLVLAHKLSAHLGYCKEELVQDLEKHFKRHALAHEIGFLGNRRPQAKDVIALMQQDKKVFKGKIGFILSRGVGKAFQSDAVSIEDLTQVLNAAGY